ncbi:MAG: radical SAM protein [Pseudomonadota bacterium]
MENASPNKKPSSCGGTQEWSVKTVNCCTGCSHNCRYCYAKGMAIRFRQVTPEQWLLERIRQKDVDKAYKKVDGQIMFPSSHDITPNNLDACMEVLGKLLASGNQVLVVSKPHLSCIQALCDEFQKYIDQILFRFSIGACNDQILSYWEPGAPCYEERKACLEFAYNAGFKTSVSVEPMLDSANIDTLIREISAYITHSIWIGTLNHSSRFGKGADALLTQAIKNVELGQTADAIKDIYARHNNNPLIRWKKEIKKVVGIPIPKKNGLDI